MIIYACGRARAYQNKGPKYQGKDGAQSATMAERETGGVHDEDISRERGLIDPPSGVFVGRGLAEGERALKTRCARVSPDATLPLPLRSHCHRHLV